MASIWRVKSEIQLTETRTGWRLTTIEKLIDGDFKSVQSVIHVLLRKVVVKALSNVNPSGGTMMLSCVSDWTAHCFVNC